jgi:hypothetical protein
VLEYKEIPMPKVKNGTGVFAEIGKVYRIADLAATPIADGLLPPKRARWRLVFWGNVIFFSNLHDTERYRDGGSWRKAEGETAGRTRQHARYGLQRWVPNLSYHQREDCMIERQVNQPQAK